MKATNQTMVQQLRQLDHKKVLRKSDVISIDAVDELIEQGLAFKLMGLVIVTKTGRVISKLTYSNKIKWLKKPKKTKKEKAKDKSKVKE